ncbi:hypothetical protein S2M10_18010 [Sphingomonas sp. S2M10]|uniref:hypothetical protein n=1 Tax=Sphingomonas sp. S2M10 TaxID=2705010 RepID=UPI001456C7F4|nr:hypothetical protein [Sphingomonas sp. S2M10]NLS26814.1 hypothetical protein [Sphingomonas sp. S2M10]
MKPYLKQSPGDIFAFEGTEYIFDRRDPDGKLTYRHISESVEYMITDPKTGFPCKPTDEDIVRLMAEGKVVKRAQDLEEGPRRAARKRELNVAAARAMDPLCEFRTVYNRAYDAAPCGKSDRKLRDLNRKLLTDPAIAGLPGAKLYAGSTLREWVNKRGKPGDRRMRDGVAMTGTGRGRRVNHPKEILVHHLAVAVGRKTTSSAHAAAKAQKAWTSYRAEIQRINRGAPTGRPDAVYPQPKTPYKGVSYTTFWRMCRDLRSSAALAAEHGAQAVYQLTGGGGVVDRHTRIGAFGMMDDTKIPALFLVDDELGIPLGQATLTIVMECVSKCIFGWGLSWDEPSSATALEAYAHANTPKAIPKDLDELYPELKWICGRLSAILLDNLAGHHSRHFEDAMMDVGTDVHFSGAHMPRDKSEMERVIGTILGLAFKDLPSATYDIPRAREFGFDPSKMTMISIQKARELLTRAICIYHLSPHKGLDGRSPALVFSRHAAKVGVSVIDNLDEFSKGNGDVEYEAQARQSGVVVFGVRYSAARAMRQLYDDLVSLQPPSEAKTKIVAFKVKVKYSRNDIGRIHVWNERTKRYVTLPAVNQDYASGLPVWAHKRVCEIAKLDMREYAGETEETAGQKLIEIRASLFNEIRNITPEASEHDRKNLAKLMDSSLFKRVVGDIVEVVDEDLSNLVQPVAADAPQFQLRDQMAAPFRQDATTQTPRANERRGSGTRRPPAGGAKTSNAANRQKAGLHQGQAMSAAPEAAARPNTSSASRKRAKWGQKYD